MVRSSVIGRNTVIVRIGPKQTLYYLTIHIFLSWTINYLLHYYLMAGIVNYRYFYGAFSLRAHWEDGEGVLSGVIETAYVIIEGLKRTEFQLWFLFGIIIYRSFRKKEKERENYENNGMFLLDYPFHIWFLVEVDSNWCLWDCLSSGLGIIVGHIITYRLAERMYRKSNQDNARFVALDMG